MKPVCILLLFSFASLSNPSASYGYDGLSDFLGEIFRGLTGQKINPVMQLQQFPPPPEAEMKKREERLNAYAGARKHWLDVHCKFTDEQREKIDGLFQAEVQASQKRLNKNNRNRQHGFSDFAPIRFTSAGAATLNFTGSAWEKKKREILTEDQVKELETAQAERSASLLNAQRLWVLNLLDHELYFTSDQRRQVLEHLQKKITGRSSQLYSLTNQNYYLKYQQPHTLLSTLPDDVLSQAQKDRLKRVSKGNVNGPASERYIMFMSNDGVDGWYTTLEDAVDQQGQRLRGMAELQILYYQQEFDLDEDAVKHLKLAAKGTALYCLADWKESSTKNLRQWEERMQQQQFGNGNFGFSVAVPNVKAVSGHQLWKHALSTLAVDSAKIATERVERRRQLEMTYVLSLLDRELWLTAQQRENFAELLEDKMPQKQISGHEYMYEIVLLAIPLVKCEKQDVEKILNPSQIEAWETLKKQYQIKGQNVRMQMQNNGNFSFNIPQ